MEVGDGSVAGWLAGWVAVWLAGWLRRWVAGVGVRGRRMQIMGSLEPMGPPEPMGSLDHRTPTCPPMWAR